MTFIPAHCAPYLHGLLRIVSSLLFMAHGTQKLLNFPTATSGQPEVMSLFWYGGILEMVGGFLLLIGLFTRPVAFILAGEMAVAYWMVHFPKNFFPALNGGDAAILFCFVFLFFASAGGGAWSADKLPKE